MGYPACRSYISFASHTTTSSRAHRPEEIQHFDTLRRMSIFGEGYHLAAPSINHAAFLAVRVQQDQILAVSGPIDRDDDIAVRTGFVTIKHISVAIIEQYDALAAPECGDGRLVPPADQDGNSRVPMRRAWQISFTNQNIAVEIEDHETFFSTDNSDIILVGIRNELADDDLVRMILSGQRPKFFTVRIHHVISDEHLVLAVSVQIGGVGGVSGHPVMTMPQKLQFIIISPQAAVSILDQDIRTHGVTGEIADTNSIDIDAIEGVLVHKERRCKESPAENLRWVQECWPVHVR